MHQPTDYIQFIVDINSINCKNQIHLLKRDLDTIMDYILISTTQQIMTPVFEESKEGPLLKNTYLLNQHDQDDNFNLDMDFGRAMISLKIFDSSKEFKMPEEKNRFVLLDSITLDKFQNKLCRELNLRHQLTFFDGNVENTIKKQNKKHLTKVLEEAMKLPWPKPVNNRMSIFVIMNVPSSLEETLEFFELENREFLDNNNNYNLVKKFLTPTARQHLRKRDISLNFVDLSPIYSDRFYKAENNENIISNLSNQLLSDSQKYFSNSLKHFGGNLLFIFRSTPAPMPGLPKYSSTLKQILALYSKELREKIKKKTENNKKSMPNSNFQNLSIASGSVKNGFFSKSNLPKTKQKFVTNNKLSQVALKSKSDQSWVQDLRNGKITLPEVPKEDEMEGKLNHIERYLNDVHEHGNFKEKNEIVDVKNKARRNLSNLFDVVENQVAKKPRLDFIQETPLEAETEMEQDFPEQFNNNSPSQCPSIDPQIEKINEEFKMPPLFENQQNSSSIYPNSAEKSDYESDLTEGLAIPKTRFSFSSQESSQEPSPNDLSATLFQNMVENFKLDVNESNNETKSSHSQGSFNCELEIQIEINPEESR